MQMIFSELILPESQHADLSLVLSRNRRPVSPQRLPATLLMHLSWQHTHAHARTHGRMQYASKTPRWLINANRLSNKYKHKCTSAHIMTGRLSDAYFTKIPPCFTHSFTKSMPGIQEPDFAFAQICSQCLECWITQGKRSGFPMQPELHDTTCVRKRGPRVCGVLVAADGKVATMSFEMERRSVYSAAHMKVM